MPSCAGGAIPSTAAAGEVLIRVRIELIAIVVGEFFPITDVPEGHNPECAGRLFNLTIGRTGVVDIAGRIAQELAINVIALIKGKNIGIALGNRRVLSSLETFSPM